MNDVETLAEVFMKFPGIGPKQAKRFVYFLLRQPEHFRKHLIRSIEGVTTSGKQCEQCFRFYTSRLGSNVCTICADESRDQGKLLLVEKELDCDAIEKTDSYDGLYFVIGGLTPLLVDKPSDHIRIRELVSLVHTKIQNNSLKEIIFALPVTQEGDMTAEYIEKTISQIVGSNVVKRSILGRGLSSGLELEYVDRDTFRSAFEGRHPS